MGCKQRQAERPWMHREGQAGLFTLLAAAVAVKLLQSYLTLCDPQMAVHQAPPSLGFSRQEPWSGLPFPSPMRESEVAESCPTLSDSMDCSLPGSSVHWIFQARLLKRDAIAFSASNYLVVFKSYNLMFGRFQGHEMEQVLKCGIQCHRDQMRDDSKESPLQRWASIKPSE